MKIYKVFIPILFILLSGCAVVDKSLAPVDNVINSTKSGYSSIENSTDETLNDLSHGVGDIKADFYENSFVKLFSDDEDILKNREENFIIWNHRSNYNCLKIVKENDLELKDKIRILNGYFFDILEKEHIEAFKKEHKMVHFDQFLTDRENIENIYNYKTALNQSEHQWNMNIHSTQKKAASLMLSTLYGEPYAKFVSYNPYDEEMFLLVLSKKNGFTQKIKLSVEKELAKEMKNSIKKVKPIIYYKLNDNVIELVGIASKFKNKTYLAKMVDRAYSRQSDIAFTSKDIDLKKLDVDYTEVIQDIEPPEWYLNMEEKNIGYGQGITLDEAKTNAYKNIAQSKRVDVNTKSSLNDSQHGSTFLSSMKNKTDIESKNVVVKNSKTIKEIKKDGIWFIAIHYDKR